MFLALWRYTQAHCACTVPPARKVWTYFLKMSIHLEGIANTHHTVTVTVHGEPNFVSYYTNTKGILCTVWTSFYVSIRVWRILTWVPIVEKCWQNANLAVLANETLVLSKLLRLSFLVLLKFCWKWTSIMTFLNIRLRGS